MSDISHLFPQLAATLENWDGRTPTSDGSDDPNHAGVTDEQVDEYLRSIGSLRAPLSPAVSGQQVPPTPEFRSGAGRTVPPGESYMEPAQEEPPPPAVEPPPPTELPFEPPDYYDIAGRRYDRRQAEAWAQFDQMVSSDPQLSQLIQNYLQHKTEPVAPPAPPTPPPPTLPNLDDLDPSYAEPIQNLYRAYQDQQAVLDRVSRQAAQAETLASQHMQRTYTDIAQGAISEFQKSRNLDDPTMQAVARAARTSGFAEKYMQGTDPLTGLPVQPDPYHAVMSALEAGYLMAPETREIVVQRTIADRAARHATDNTRKQKLAGVSGASGSVPRTQTVPTNPQDARAAMTEEVSQMLNGSWVGDGTP